MRTPRLRDWRGCPSSQSLWGAENRLYSCFTWSSSALFWRVEVASVLVKGIEGLCTLTSTQQTKQLVSQHKSCDMEFVGIKKCIWYRRESMDSGVRKTWVQIPAWPLNGCVIGQWVSLSSPVKWSLPHRYYCSDSMTYTTRKGPMCINILLVYLHFSLLSTVFFLRRIRRECLSRLN